MDPEILAFFQKFTPKSFPAKITIIPGLPEPKGIYFITSGIVKMYGMTPKDQTYIHNYLKPGCLFPLIWLMTDLPNRYYFDTVTPVTGFRAEKSQVLSFLQQNPRANLAIAHRFLTGLDGYLEQAEIVSSGTAQQKIENALNVLEKRFGPDFKKNIKLTHQELANLTGLSRETVTREIGK
jgi:CRP-like cAMP-binding protein